MFKLNPIFVYYGIEDGPNAIYMLDLDGRKRHFLIGTNNGRCLFYSLETFKLISCLYSKF